MIVLLSQLVFVGSPLQIPLTTCLRNEFPTILNREFPYAWACLSWSARKAFSNTRGSHMPLYTGAVSVLAQQ
jgi:hypothetical protein